MAVLVVLTTAPVAGYRQRPFSIFGSDVSISEAFHGKVYYLSEGTTHMPVFRTMKPIGDVYATSLNVPTQDYEEGFPGVHGRVEFFGIDYDGYFWVSKPGEYHFSLTSDDGSLLFVDDRLVVNNDGEHFTQEMRGKIELGPGSHHIRVEYFQSVRYAVALILQIAPPGESYRLFDMRDYKRPLQVDYNPVAPGGSYIETLHPAARAAYDALTTEPLPRDFEYGTRALRFPSGDETSQYAIAVEIPHSSLTAQKGRLEAQFVAIVRDGGGNVIERITRTFSAMVSTPRQIPAFNYEQTIRLSPGFYTIETAAVDWPSGRVSTSVLQLYNSPRHGIALSDVILIQRLNDLVDAVDTNDPFQAQGKRVTPLLSSVLQRGAAPYVYFVAYPDERNKTPARLQVQVISDGEVLDSQASDLPVQGRDGRIPMVIGTAAGHGRYEVQIRVMQGAESTCRQIEYSIQ